MEEFVVEKGAFKFKCLRNTVEVPAHTLLLTYKPAVEKTKEKSIRLEGATIVGDGKRQKITGKQTKTDD